MVAHEDTGFRSLYAGPVPSKAATAIMECGHRPGRVGNLLGPRPVQSARVSAPRRKHEVAGRQHAHGRAGTDRDRWRDIEISLGDPITNTRGVRLPSLAKVHGVGLAFDLIMVSAV